MLAVDALLSAYTSGWFPMAVGPGDIRWYSPDPRGIIPLDAFHASRRLARSARQNRFEVRVDTAFRAVMEGCAQRVDEDGNWIDEEIIESYCGLRARGYALLDTQWVTEHLAQFGAVEIPRRRYLRLLEEALRVDASFS
jgi:leucyl/phenylalanyl-tRNA---protein transferase